MYFSNDENHIRIVKAIVLRNSSFEKAIMIFFATSLTEINFVEAHTLGKVIGRKEEKNFVIHQLFSSSLKYWQKK